jgi:Tol biopolymer transport system component
MKSIVCASGVGRNGNWAVFEVDSQGGNLRELTPDDQPDVQWFDSCYLPEDGTLLTCSTAGMQGLPCVNGGQPMVNLYHVNTRAGRVRQLTFEQDSDWHPRVMDDGRVMYLRWEYADTPQAGGILNEY